MVEWECPTNPREASGLDPEAVHAMNRIAGRLNGDDEFTSGHSYHTRSSGDR